MKLYQLILKDISRRKKRVLYAALGVIIGTMTVVGILTVADSGQSRIVNQLEKYGPNLTITPAISSLDMTLGNLSLGQVTVGETYIPDSRIAEIQDIADKQIREALSNGQIQAILPGIDADSNVATVAPRLYSVTAVNDAQAMVVGIYPAAELKVRTWWKIQSGTYLDKGNEVLLGSTVATVLSLESGDTVRIHGADFLVAGVLEETGSADDTQLFTNLATLQKVSGKVGLVSMIDVRALCNACPVETIAAAINGAVPGVRAVAVKQVAQSELGMLDRINRLMLALGGVTLFIGAFGVANTMMTSVHERRKDIGIMRAVGSSQNQILFAFLEEAVIVGLIGGVFGYLFGSALAYAIGPLIFEGTAIRYVIAFLPLSLGVSVLVAVLAAAYPAYRATRIRVADSFRSL
ncbi:ABC-type transport system, involved in lipoprotein release, permease component [Dehalogenimonas alkenigignens]|uniref:ABC-type transport system, involved in lipoprotein release, permease component n=1 Tax=Dehalogenimonas alkenigignens TaxID=1217799 RepID=A0A0W0GL69_9CHLR|nr:FtsX-like permease family protein [Dehalogenimonas alkenigignens]KTB49286.1 ABC-type transport system, involved in lipoprotein release, permease component [Dehalogenimonas alkenigignens]